MPTLLLDALEDAAAWRELLARLPAEMQDVYFLPEYVSLHRFIPGSRALLFAYSEGDTLWLHPLVVQPIASVGEHPIEGGWSDIETPYGYGGPLASGDDPDFLARAHAAYAEWCRSEGVVAEFLRLHPLLPSERWLSPEAEVLLDRSTVSLRLDALGEDLTVFKSETRNMLRRASREGVRVHAYPAGERLAEFVTLYRKAMGRLGADDYYYFTDEYFAGLCRLTDERGWLLAAEQEDGGWLAAALFLRGERWLHYHLSASDFDRRVPGVVNSVLFEAGMRGKAHGMERFHLGGGRTPATDDSLFKFKSTMATDSHRFLIAKRVHDPEAYATLRTLWCERYPHLESRYGRRLLCYRYSA